MLRRSRVLSFIGLACGLAVGIALSFVAPADATRNSGGTYSLPTGSTVTSGTTITSTWANTLTGDIATELTNSLDRNGRGAMLAPLQCSSGSVSAPSLTFSADTDTGLYRIGANNPGMSVGGVKVQEWATTGSTFPLLLAVTGAQTNAAGLTATQSTSNGSAITATGDGSGKGGVFTGGSTGQGLTATAGGGNTTGGTLTGTGTGAGATGVGGSTAAGGYGGSFTGGGTNAAGALCTGGGTGAGVLAVGGGSAGTGGPGIVVTSNGTTRGSIEFGDANPASTQGFSNVIRASSVPKAWGHLESSGAGALTVSAGFNIASVACGGAGNDDFIVTMATGASGTNNYAVSPSLTASTVSTTVTHTSATVFSIRGGTCDTVATGVDFVVMGLQ